MPTVYAPGTNIKATYWLWEAEFAAGCPTGRGEVTQALKEVEGIVVHDGMSLDDMIRAIDIMALACARRPTIETTVGAVALGWPSGGEMIGEKDGN